ncbi:hypothetical protein ACOSP7_015101 [Xanthoceras sorbifolium]|uniref:Protein BIG GRAIN 1-like B n=1 Tax=Xanthoceras sorbifolium TaxID=99658 RepID=A0ABQ8I634_9ROSI|nr:hypothetical protein JRO89_XS04G0199300 [Xanthoceras sorbifolium]
MYRRDRSLRENAFPQRRRTPSFSSSLLDTIYRSIDESNGDEEELGGFYREKTMVKKQRNCSVKHATCLEEANLRRDVMIESWIEKQSSHGFNSTSSSSDSSSGGLFSSSEAESSYKDKSRRSKPVRSMKCMQFELRNDEKPKREGGGFTKTKLKALKIYGELKKVKQPISPGGRITSFLNSIFSSGNAKKVNICSVKAMDDVNFERKSKSACSSATSFSRSCLSKTPSSRGNNSKYSSSNGMKRSVRFYPVSVIVDEDCRPCGHKCIYEDDPTLLPLPNVQKIVKSCSLKEELKNYVMEKETEVGKFLAQDYLKKGINEFVSRGFGVEDEDEDEEEDDADALSYSSSDLFELDHLIGIGRYREELPVYETTNFKKNQAIANGFIL